MKIIAAMLISLLAFYSAASLAQTYKCTSGGKTVYSDLPCGGNARKISEDGNSVAAPNASGGPKEAGAQSCKTGVKNFTAWKDPDGLRIENIAGGEMEVIDYADKKVGARRYSVRVNAKNSNGGYVGEKPIVCFTSQDGMRILKMDSAMIDGSTIN